MVESAFGPFLFDTSAESWLERSADPAVQRWLARYLELHSMCVSAITVMERLRGFALRLERAAREERAQVALTRQAYIDTHGEAWPVGPVVAAAAAQLSALLRQPPSGPNRAHRAIESRQERLVRWRFDILIAATALVAAVPLVHHNPRDFETIRMAIETSPERFPTLGPLNLISVLRLAV